MKTSDPSRKGPLEGVWRGGRKECPFCIQVLGAGNLHICPAQCCYVRGFEGDEEVVCPYDGIRFQTTEGHICLDLMLRTEPAQ